MAKRKKNDTAVAWLVGGGVLAFLILASRSQDEDEGSAVESGSSLALPRGLKNNNPLNLILTDIRWAGEVDPEDNTDGKFEQFKTPEYGYRAAIKNLRYYNEVKDWRTIRQIIDHWDSGVLGDSENYIKYVAQRLGLTGTFGENYAFPNWGKEFFYNKEALWKLVRAMAEFENGTKDPNLIKYSDYSKGFDLT